SRGGIVGTGPVGADADDLVLAADADYQRRRVRLAKVGVLSARSRAFCLPGESPRFLVKRGDILHVQPIAVEDQQVAAQNRRTTWPLLVIEAKFLIDPEDFSGSGLQAGSAECTEMDVQPAIVEDRRRRGVAVLRIDRGRVLDTKDLDVAQQPPAIG